MLRKNVGGVDRILRVILGISLFAAGLVMLATETSYGPVATVIGFLVLMSGILGSCGLYLPFNISTAHPQAGRIKRLCCGEAGDARPAGRAEPEQEIRRGPAKDAGL